MLQRNDQLLSSANLTVVTVLQSRRQDNSLIGLKVAVIDVQAYALRLKTQVCFACFAFARVCFA